MSPTHGLVKKMSERPIPPAKERQGDVNEAEDKMAICLHNLHLCGGMAALIRHHPWIGEYVSAWAICCCEWIA